MLDDSRTSPIKCFVLIHSDEYDIFYPQFSFNAKRPFSFYAIYTSTHVSTFVEDFANAASCKIAKADSNTRRGSSSASASPTAGRTSLPSATRKVTPERGKRGTVQGHLEGNKNYV